MIFSLSFAFAEKHAWVCLDESTALPLLSSLSSATNIPHLKIHYSNPSVGVTAVLLDCS